MEKSDLPVILNEFHFPRFSTLETLSGTRLRWKLQKLRNYAVQFGLGLRKKKSFLALTRNITSLGLLAVSTVCLLENSED